MNRIDFIEKLIEQVNHHTFFHLHKDRQSGEQGCGWAGGVLMYSPNKSTPKPTEHALWMKNILSRISEANTKIDKANIANEILVWGGMRLRVTDKDKNFDRVLMATANTNEDCNAPMNSSYTKIAALFGYNLDHNTIWDSRVSSAVCYRLALIAEEHKIHPNELQNIFPDLGYIPGRSKRYERRQSLLKKYWTSVYGKWSGHRAGAILLSEISTALVQNQIPTPREVKPLTDIWNSWLVNMVFFIDDLPYQTTSSSISKKNPSTLRSIDSQKFTAFWEWLKKNKSSISTLKHKENKTITTSVYSERLVINAGNGSLQPPISKESVFRYIEEYKNDKINPIKGNKRYVIALYQYWAKHVDLQANSVIKLPL